MIDSFLVDWFGDLPILIDDPVQSANVRERLARSIDGLVADGCDAIVIVAHSGGALVSFEFLLDPAYATLPVDKLITLGQGLGLAWRLAAEPDVEAIDAGHRLVGNLARARPGLRWVDVWATYDPAPAGPLPARGGIAPGDADDDVAAGAPIVVATADPATDGWLLQSDVGATDPDPVAPTITVESRPVTNQMNVLTDHGGYWANPEGFLVPLVRHLDAARGGASDSRFYRDRTDRARRILWRRQRVGALAAWGWLCTTATAVALLVLVALQISGDERLTRTGGWIARVWDAVPGSELISGPVGAVSGAIGALLGTIGLGGLAGVAWHARTTAAGARAPGRPGLRPGQGRGRTLGRLGPPGAAGHAPGTARAAAARWSRIRGAAPARWSGRFPAGHVRTGSGRRPGHRPGRGGRPGGPVHAPVRARPPSPAPVSAARLAVASLSAGPSDRDRLAVLPEDAAQDRALLAERGIGLGTADEVGHEVRVAGARP